MVDFNKQIEEKRKLIKELSLRVISSQQDTGFRFKGVFHEREAVYQEYKANGKMCVYFGIKLSKNVIGMKRIVKYLLVEFIMMLGGVVLFINAFNFNKFYAVLFYIIPFFIFKFLQRKIPLPITFTKFKNIGVSSNYVYFFIRDELIPSEISTQRIFKIYKSLYDFSKRLEENFEKEMFVSVFKFQKNTNELIDLLGV